MYVGHEEIINLDLNEKLLSVLVSYGDLVDDLEYIDLKRLINISQDIEDNQSFQNSVIVDSILDEYIDKIVTFQTERITTDFKMLSLWYILSLLKDKTQQNEIDELFYTIFLQINNLESIFNDLESMKFFLRNKTVKEHIDSLFSHNQESVNISFVYKLFYITFLCYERSEEFLYLYEKLKEIYYEAIKQSNEELVFYLYYPLILSHNTIKMTNDDFRAFNENIEKLLESFIIEKMVPKYGISPLKKENKKKRMAFILERISPNSIYLVFDRLMEYLSKQESLEYEISIYNINMYELNGSEKEYIKRVKSFGFEYIDFHKMFVGNEEFIYSIPQKCMKIREYIINRGIDTLIMFNGRPEFDFLFATRTAPQQIYWSHGNNQYDVEGIDKRISHFVQSSNEYDFEVFNMPMDINRYNPEVNMDFVKKVRARYPKDVFILGTIGRLVKINDDEYLDAVAKIMNDNPNTIYLACGSGNSKMLREKVEKLGIADRFYFPGHIDPHIFGHLIELWLEPFKYTSGESLNEYMYKARPWISLWNGWTEELKREESYSYDKYVWPYSIENYIEIANELIENPDIRNYVLEKRSAVQLNNLKKRNETFLTDWNKVLCVE